MIVNTRVSFESLQVARGTRDCVLPPQWVLDLIGRAEGGGAGEANGVEVNEAGEFALVSARVADAVALDAGMLERRVAEVYGAIVEKIGTLFANRPVRLWNHIPSIHERMEARRNRYMIFNAGRYRAFSLHYGGPRAFDRKLATASGIGHGGRDLIVHCLSTQGVAIAVENPRQIAPHRYSARYGTLPPCFARAMVLPDSGLILVGGTASIKGEESLHGASLDLQWQETLTNLASVVETAHAKASAAGARGRDEWLGQFREVRVYYPRAADGDGLAAMGREAFGDRCRIEMRRADLCRSELLVEIEGVATLKT